MHQKLKKYKKISETACLARIPVNLRLCLRIFC